MLTTAPRQSKVTPVCIFILKLIQKCSVQASGLKLILSFTEICKQLFCRVPLSRQKPWQTYIRMRMQTKILSTEMTILKRQCTINYSDEVNTSNAKSVNVTWNRWKVRNVGCGDNYTSRETSACADLDVFSFSKCGNKVFMCPRFMLWTLESETVVHKYSCVLDLCFEHLSPMVSSSQVPKIKPFAHVLKRWILSSIVVTFQ